MQKHCNMKKLALLALAALCLTGCWTRIWTVAPTTEYVAPVKTVYTTQVTTPTPKVVTTTTVTVTSFNSDISFYLDLHAVAAAFAESRSVQEFEQLLNSPRYMINNLDLNRDGWIDYLRVLETRQGYYHALLIQACLAPSVFQDVATLVAEHRANTLYVEVIGDPYLYGYNYIVRPTFVKRPPMWDVYGHPTYNPWVSPYYYGYYPSYFNNPKPIYLSHYQAYVNTYLSHHHYCNHCDFPPQPFYNGYAQMTQQNTRRDYQNAHPNDSFEQRVTHQLTPNGSGVTVRNAGQLRTETQRQAKAAAENKSSESKSSTSSRTSGTSSSSRTSGTSSSTTSGTSGTSTRTSGTSTTTTQTTQATQKRQPSTSVDTRVKKSGETRTTIKTTDTTGRTTTVKRESTPAKSQSNTRTSSSNTRSSSSNTRSSSSTSSSSTRTSGTSTRQQR